MASYERLTREFYYLEVARLTAQRGTCSRAQVGAILVRGKRIIATGYNGAPPGMPHCEHSSDEHPNSGCKTAVHAEANALAFAARHGVSVEGGEMWCTHAPCLACAQLILSAGLWQVNYNMHYRDTSGVKLLHQAGLEVISHDD